MRNCMVMGGNWGNRIRLFKTVIGRKLVGRNCSCYPLFLSQDNDFWRKNIFAQYTMFMYWWSASEFVYNCWHFVIFLLEWNHLLSDSICLKKGHSAITYLCRFLKAQIPSLCSVSVTRAAWVLNLIPFLYLAGSIPQSLCLIDSDSIHTARFSQEKQDRGRVRGEGGLPTEAKRSTCVSAEISVTHYFLLVILGSSLNTKLIS